MILHSFYILEFFKITFVEKSFKNYFIKLNIINAKTEFYL